MNSCFDILDRKWDEEVANSKEKGKKPSLVWAVIKTYGLTYAFHGILFSCEVRPVSLYRVSQKKVNT